MKPRTCRIVIGITNDKGDDSLYSLRPVAPAELGQSAAAFRLTKVSSIEEQSVYVVRLSIDGQATCNCPQQHFGGGCKHADALIASGILPCSLLSLLINRTRLLDEAEEKLARTGRDLQAAHKQLDAVSARAVQLQNAFAAIPPAKPKRPRKPRRVAQAA